MKHENEKWKSMQCVSPAGFQSIIKGIFKTVNLVLIVSFQKASQMTPLARVCKLKPEPFNLESVTLTTQPHVANFSSKPRHILGEQGHADTWTTRLNANLTHMLRKVIMYHNIIESVCFLSCLLYPGKHILFHVTWKGIGQSTDAML